jgi:Pyruvate/2-oxoacid:ferredoxin oxidoreductase gamma subunit
MDNKKEYIQISKEDFEKMYKTLNKVLKVLKEDYNDLKIAYEILNKKEKILENILNKNIIKDLNKVRIYTNIVMFSLVTHHIDLKEDIKRILEKVKKEQIDKNNG